MAREGYSNLSVPEDRFEEFRKILDTIDNDKSVAQYSMMVLESSVVKLRYLQKHLSHITFSGIGKNGMALFDEKTDELVRIYTKESKLLCSIHKEEPCDHKVFAAMHPEFVL